MLKNSIKKFFFSLNSSQWREIFFYLLYFVLIFLLVFPSNSLLKGALIILFFSLIWKTIVGMSWLSFSYLLLGYIELRVLANWLKPFWLIIIALILLWLFFRKIILNKKSSQFLSYFITTGWILMSYGLYFYLNWPFFVSFLIYLLGLTIVSYLNFLSLEKEISLNYLIYLLLNLEAYWMLSYLSLNGLQFGGLILLFQYLILYFV
ncbi:MAG: hypothetical protein WC306_02035 [Candidatus Paceibacterota bacterium]|jgi:hypothetical protein